VGDKSVLYRSTLLLGIILFCLSAISGMQANSKLSQDNNGEMMNIILDDSIDSVKYQGHD
jgi:hypothetical protein